MTGSLVSAPANAGVSCVLLTGLLCGGAWDGPRDPPAPPPAASAGPSQVSRAVGGCETRAYRVASAHTTLRTAFERLARVARRLEPTAFPSVTDEDWTWQTTSADAWTSGFFPGSLWLAYDHTHRRAFESWARSWTRQLASRSRVTSTHDVGFQVMTSFGNGERVAHRAAYRSTMLRAAHSLAIRYDATVGAIRSWGPRRNRLHFKVIVDGMMNLNLLWWASAHGGSPTWRRRAVRHAETTKTHFLRADGSVRHLVDFDPGTGRVVTVGNPQGYRPTSMWARGQAWAIDGFATAYAATDRPTFLRAARRAASYYLAHVPTDCVPYWDFNAPGIPDAPKDASAAAVAAEGFAELAEVDPSRTRRTRSRAAAASVLRSLSDNYVAPSGEAVLDGSVSTYGVDPPDIGTAYGDYYFLHAVETWLGEHHRRAKRGPTRAQHSCPSSCRSTSERASQAAP